MEALAVGMCRYEVCFPHGRLAIPQGPGYSDWYVCRSGWINEVIGVSARLAWVAPPRMGDSDWDREEAHGFAIACEMLLLSA